MDRPTEPDRFASMAAIAPRGSLARFVAFVALIAAVVWYVAIRVGQFRASVAEPAQTVSAPLDASSMQPPGSIGDAADLFAEFRLVREQARSQEIETLSALAESGTADPEVRKAAQQKLMALTERIEKEISLELLIRSRNFSDAIVFLQEGNAQVIVRTAKLTREQAAQIGDLVGRATGLGPEQIVIQARGD